MAVTLNSYIYTVSYSVPEGLFVGTVAEMPTLSWSAATRQEAFNGIQALVAGALANLTRPKTDHAEQRMRGLAHRSSFVSELK